jgi:hypothetical protein
MMELWKVHLAEACGHDLSASWKVGAIIKSKYSLWWTYIL